MARNKISLYDRAVVKARLAAGLSFTKAMDGTHIRSTNTVFKISNEEKNNIAKMREEFVVMVEGLGGDQYTQAQQLARMVTAQKPYGKNAILHDDWRSQLDAIKFLLQMRGIAPDEKAGVAINIFNNPDFIAQYDKRKK